MTFDAIALTSELSGEEKIQFQVAYGNERKSVGVAVVLAILLGHFGARKFYLGQPGLGVLYLLFFWTFIPSLVAIIEACFMGKTVKNYNSAKALQIIESIKMARN